MGCARSKISCPSDALGASGQASIEAAALLPALSLVFLLLLQPLCLFYTETVMWEAAAETARACLTCGSDSVLHAFAERRLEAVPDLSIFHQGAWEIEVAGLEEAEATVTIATHAEPLPLFGALATAGGRHDGRGIELRVSVTERLRPPWAEGGYSDWIEVWDHGGA